MKLNEEFHKNKDFVLFNDKAIIDKNMIYKVLITKEQIYGQNHTRTKPEEYYEVSVISTHGDKTVVDTANSLSEAEVKLKAVLALLV